MFLNFSLTSSSQLLMCISVQWHMYQCYLSLNLSFLSHWKVLVFSTLYDDRCALSSFCVFSLFQFLWHNLFFSCNSVICLLLSTIIFVWYFCKVTMCPFKFLSAADAYFFTWDRFVLSYVRFFVIRWFWWLLPEETAEIHHFFLITPLSFTMTWFSFFGCSNCCKITSLFATASSAICWAYFESDSNEEVFYLSWATRTGFLPYDLPVFISKLYECNKVELSDTFLDDFAHFNFFCSNWMVISPFYSFPSPN